MHPLRTTCLSPLGGALSTHPSSYTPISIFGAPRIKFQGNPTKYGVWIDETLNLLFRSCAERAHQIKFEPRIFKMFRTIAHLGLDKRIYVPMDD